MSNTFSLGVSVTPVTLTAATTLTSANAGRLHLLDASGGFTVTLPASVGNGARFRFQVKTVSTTGYVVQVANATDVMQGAVFTVSDGAAAVLGYATASTSDTITLNGTTKGGVTIGDWFELTDYAAGFFAITGFTTSSGTEATPFSAAVS